MVTVTFGREAEEALPSLWISLYIKIEKKKEKKLCRELWMKQTSD